VGLWTELVRGQTLEELLGQQGKLSADEAAHIGKDLCRALAAVHSAGLIHRDVKTANVMREEGGRIVLLDFNIATERNLAGNGGACGTLRYMAPEQSEGRGASIQSDIYALGVVLYRLVTESYPVAAENREELLAKLRAGEITPLRDARPDLPGAFVKVVERALALDPDDRFASAGMMERALEGLDQRRRDDRRRQPEPSGKRSRLRWGAAIAVGIVALSIAAWLISKWIAVPLEGQAQLVRNDDGIEQKLVDGARVRPGERILLEFEGTRDAHLYVLNEDSLGHLSVLFPLGGQTDLANPLSARELHRLPGSRDGVQGHWVVNDSGERETFLVVASVEPLTELERTIAELPRAGDPLPPEGKRHVTRVLRGVSGLEFEPGPDSPGPDLSRLAAELYSQARSDGKLWVWTVRLENAGRE
jgi:hypothetical protein